MAHLYSLLGWVLLEAWLIPMGTGFLVHIVVAIPGLTLTIRSALRPPIDGRSTLEDKQRPATQFHWATTSCTLLYVVGAILGFMVLIGSLTLLAAVIAAFMFAPWARLPSSHNHPVISCLIATTGFTSLIAVGHHSVDTMFLPLAAWAFWGFACCALLFRAEQLTRSKHENKPAAGTVKTPTSPVHSAGR